MKQQAVSGDTPGLQDFGRDLEEHPDRPFPLPFITVTPELQPNGA